MRLDRLPSLLRRTEFRAVLETPRGSRNKFDYDPETRAMLLKKTLPEGMAFPFDFGFIPGTKGADGDPLDVLILMDEPTYPGCLVACRLIGVMQAEQTEKDGGSERNDRFLAVAQTSLEYEEIHDVRDLPKRVMPQIEEFFACYNKLEGRRFKPLRVSGPKAALKLIKAQRRR